MSSRCLYILLSLTILAGCGAGEDKVSNQDNDAADPVRTETVRGPVSLSVEVAPGVVRLSDEPTLTLTIKASPGVQITKPPFGASVGEFLIRDYHEPPPAVEVKDEVTRLIYKLEPTRAGTLTIAPIAVRFKDNRPNGDGEEYVVESEVLQVEVNTIVGEAAPSLEDLKPSLGPVELPSTGPSAWVWGITALVSGAIAGLVWWLRRRRRRAQLEPPLTAQQLARIELDQIIRQRLSEADVKEFYVEVTGVVRRYIERSTGIRAPEQTTEEFLHEILSKTVFSDDEQRRLQQFLESADLVKFAGYQPAREDMDSSIERAREFTQRDSSQTEETVE
ncbi:MAG: LPXTG cell wall anchor domain-containing protein [Fuerstiella sp.]|nr:LPXTG cell wall anchor domain-containing protein [Fuerstiella sp.]